jgi:hypothetical protein
MFWQEMLTSSKRGRTRVQVNLSSFMNLGCFQVFDLLLISKSIVDFKTLK